MSAVNTLNEANNTTRKEATELVQKQPIEGTPFVLVRKEDKFFLVMGKYRVSPVLESEQDAKDYVFTNTWNLIATVAGIVAEETLQYKVNEGPIKGRVVVDEQIFNNEKPIQS